MIFFSFNLSGCVWFLVGASAAGGYAVSRDTIAGEIDAEYNDVWLAAKNVSQIMGIIKEEDRAKGFLDLNVDKSHVVINIDRLTPETLRLKIKARKYLMPNIGLAQKLFIKINQQIE
ncbi:MAG: hypothetical protein COV72_05365 [Candidatus Omnitrophica bacterium CG11_big_fil_rev_8_21_14_0_20_42_13]|uniref:DUF3568 domain-containing protein n=1 Tax=Candidatus Ghiorseimicrobium undicola TaxID=1974746 RepID=A0A2H0LXB9_9BACT|nr:MAG: hypothetical protein COV72_05365 [Candidatus Omnitrophica bacterium CG11_big_fil_rev_8_21_14_0_20_42_13]